MKKRHVLLGLALIALLALPVASAYGYGRCRGRQVLKLLEKDPDTWQPVPGGASGRVVGFGGRAVLLQARGLEPNTSYTLIYYGDKTLGKNDEWPHATCITRKTTNRRGRLFKLQRLRYCPVLQSVLNNGIDEKIWLVPSSDVDCDGGVLTSWNPTGILFEEHTI